jgi:NAD(P)H-hydrate epimerase
MITPFAEDIFAVPDAEIAADIADQWADVVVIGCGFFGAEANAVLHFLKNYEGHLVIDGGALQQNITGEIAGRNNLLITPHAGEFKRMFEQEPSQQNVKQKAQQLGITILSKGATDIIANREENESNTTGCPQMTVGGTGDGLAGICAGLLAQGYSPVDAARTAAFFYGKAGERLAQKQRVFSAQELIDLFRRLHEDQLLC